MEVCPLCGYNEKRSSKLEHNIMNRYINRDNPKDVCVMNSVLEEVKTDKGVVYVRDDKYGKPKTPASTPTSPIIAQPPAVPTQQAPIQEVNKPAVSNSGWPVNPPTAQP